MEGRLISALLVCLALTDYGLGAAIVTRGVPCPAISCRPIKRCPLGYVFDENGCQTCRCKAVACPLIGCIDPCPFGYVRDVNGCPTCECRKEPKCQIFCTLEYAPVCGSDGKTYGNICFLNGADCVSEEDITIVHPGPCLKKQKSLESSGVACPLIGCINLCPFGYVRDENGCPTCQCRKLKCRKKFCTLQYAPVCGSDGKTYGNICSLNAADCDSEEDITIVHHGPCRVPCPLIACINLCPFGYVRDENGCPTCQCKKLKCRKKFCTLQYAPVCGSDGKTYGNICSLNAADCDSEEDITIVHPGPCQPNCPKPCTMIYRPVCGSDGKTYSNECVLENADCLSEEDITKVHDGPCRVPCPLIGCINLCPFGYARDENGCPTCQCKSR